LLKPSELAAAPSELSWPEDAQESFRFGLRTRAGRVFYMYATSPQDLHKWLVGLQAIGANISLSDFQLAHEASPPADAEEIQALREVIQRARYLQRTSSTPKLLKKPSVANAINDSPAQGFAHKVVGGVVIRTDKN
jgi:hypothetical protein